MSNFTQAITALREHESYALSELQRALTDPNAPIENHQLLLGNLHDYRAAIAVLQDAMKITKVDFGSLEDAIRNGVQQPS